VQSAGKSRAEDFALLLITMNPDLAFPDLPFDPPFYRDLDSFPCRRENKGKPSEISDKTRSDEESASHQEHGAVDEIITGDLPLLDLPLYAGNDPEPLLTGIVGPQDSRNNDDHDGVHCADGLAYLDNEVKLQGRNDCKKKEKPEKHAEPLSIEYIFFTTALMKTWSNV